MKQVQKLANSILYFDNLDRKGVFLFSCIVFFFCLIKYGGQLQPQEPLKASSIEELKCLIECIESEKKIEIESTSNWRKSRYPKNKIYLESTAFNERIKQKVVVDINKADEKKWEALYGIGPYFAKKIVRFRESLGGFASIDQVGQTYHLPDSTFRKIKSHLILSPITRKIHINHEDEVSLKKHPYIDWKQAKVIIAYRSKHGPFSNTTELGKIKILSSEDVKRLDPYLSFD